MVTGGRQVAKGCQRSNCVMKMHSQAPAADVVLSASSIIRPAPCCKFGLNMQTAWYQDKIRLVPGGDCCHVFPFPFQQRCGAAVQSADGSADESSCRALWCREFCCSHPAAPCGKSGRPSPHCGSKAAAGAGVVGEGQGRQHRTECKQEDRQHVRWQTAM